MTGTPDIGRELRGSLGAFSNLQRQLAASDFTAVTSVRRTMEKAGSSKLAQIGAVQEAIARNFGRSIDFSRLALRFKAFENREILRAAEARAQWARSLAESMDVTALRSAITSSTGLNYPELADLQRQAEIFARIAQGITVKLPTVDFAQFFGDLDQWLPTNLQRVDCLDVVAEISLDEGIPLSWVPREEIVLALVSAGTRHEREAVLIERTNDILDDCEAGLSDGDDELTQQCRSALAAFRSGFDAPAQSHASNIIDSIVLALHGNKGREEAKKLAEEVFDDLPLRLAAENLTLRPLFRAFASWWPSSGVPPPDHFARHVTSHAVGHAGVFAPFPALVAVMLATSLTIQYRSTGASPVTTDDLKPCHGSSSGLRP